MSHKHIAEVDVAVLLPKITDWERTNIRYGGFAQQIVGLGLSTVFVESHDNYRVGGAFTNGREPIDPHFSDMGELRSVEVVVPKLVRDLTMPTTSKPIYEDPAAPKLVHHPSINNLLISKSKVYDLMPEFQPLSIGHVAAHDVAEAVSAIPGKRIVIKPDTGAASQGVIIGEKKDALEQHVKDSGKGIFIVQEAIDMSHGLAEHNVEGVHNVRIIVIGGAAIYGFIRTGESGGLILEGETFKNRTFLPTHAFKDSLQAVLMGAQEKFTVLPHSHETVVAFDLVRGIGHDNEQHEYILEINRRPLRNSPHDGTDDNTVWASKQWDKAEASMLQGALTGSTN